MEVFLLVEGVQDSIASACTTTTEEKVVLDVAMSKDSRTDLVIIPILNNAF
jgi:hypothetical protein